VNKEHWHKSRAWNCTVYTCVCFTVSEWTEHL